MMDIRYLWSWQGELLALACQLSPCADVDLPGFCVRKTYEGQLLKTCCFPSLSTVTETLFSVLLPHFGQNFFSIRGVVWKQA